MHCLQLASSPQLGCRSGDSAEGAGWDPRQHSLHLCFPFQSCCRTSMPSSVSSLVNVDKSWGLTKGTGTTPRTTAAHHFRAFERTGASWVLGSRRTVNKALPWLRSYSGSLIFLALETFLPMPTRPHSTHRLFILWRHSKIQNLFQQAGVDF